MGLVHSPFDVAANTFPAVHAHLHEALQGGFADLAGRIHVQHAIGDSTAIDDYIHDAHDCVSAIQELQQQINDGGVDNQDDLIRQLHTLRSRLSHMVDNGSRDGAAWLDAPLSDPRCRLDGAQFGLLMRMRLGCATMLTPAAVCPLHHAHDSPREVDVFGFHVWNHCNRGRYDPHEGLKGGFQHVARAAGHSIVREPLIFDLTSPQGHALRVDAAMVDPAGKALLIDFSVASVTSNSALPPSADVESIVSQPQRVQAARVAAKRGKYEATVQLAGHRFLALVASPGGILDAASSSFVRSLAPRQPAPHQEEELFVQPAFSRPHVWNTPRHMLALVQIGLLKGVAKAVPKRHESLMRALQRRHLLPVGH